MLLLLRKQDLQKQDKYTSVAKKATTNTQHVVTEYCDVKALKHAAHIVNMKVQIHMFLL